LQVEAFRGHTLIDARAHNEKYMQTSIISLTPTTIRGRVATGRIVITHAGPAAKGSYAYSEHNKPPRLPCAIPWDCTAEAAAATAAGDTIERPEFDSMQKSRRLCIIYVRYRRENERRE